jgi:hypothetical protein
MTGKIGSFAETSDESRLRLATEAIRDMANELGPAAKVGWNMERRVRFKQNERDTLMEKAKISSNRNQQGACDHQSRRLRPAGRLQAQMTLSYELYMRWL